MTYYYIYKITLLKGRLKNHYYYGQHRTKRLQDKYIGSGIKIKDYFKKYKAIEGETYIKEIIKFCNNIEELNKAEYEIIGDKYETDKMCLNLKAGGCQAELSSESRNKMREKANKKWEDPEFHKIYSNAAKKRYEDPEERMKVSQSQKKRYEDPEERRKNKEAQKKSWDNPEKRRKASETHKKRFEDPEEREKARRAAKKRTENPEWVKHQRESQTGKKRSVITRKRQSESLKGILIGTKYVNNGIKERKVKGEELQKLLNEGYVYGRLKRKT
jgi:hypothetical protein